MIQLTRTGAHVLTAGGDLTELRTRFAGEHCLHLPRLIEPSLLQLIQRRIDESGFRPFVSDGVGHDSNLTDQLSLHILYFVTNDPPFLETIREITASPEIDAFHGRVYRMDPALPTSDSWHDDMCENRTIGMSLNLSEAPFEGSVFQLRDRRSNQILHETANTGSGDAIIFRLAHDLEHRNTAVTGSVPKTAFAGWFRSGQAAYFPFTRPAMR